MAVYNRFYRQPVMTHARIVDQYLSFVNDCAVLYLQIFKMTHITGSSNISTENALI